MPGRKIEKQYENFIDSLLVDFTEKVNPFYHKIGFNPNILTTFSLFFTLLSYYIFYKDNYLLAGIFYMIGYYFDCADGNFARTYDMVTKFGDYYDHSSDTFKIIILILIFYSKLGFSKNLYIILSILLILIASLSVHMGCQEIIYNKNESETLGVLTSLCPDPNIIKYTKNFGVGTFQLVITLFIIFFKEIEN